jgi:alpha-tubulin suppressor-like RCC1 family protein
VALALASCGGSTHTHVDVRVAIVRTPAAVLVASPRATPARPAAPERPGAVMPPCGAGGGAPAAIAQLALGPGRTCTRHTDGALCCWGALAGVAARDDAMARVERPARVASVANVTAVGVGADHVCALSADGAVLCWGDNTYGQLGDGSARDRETPAAVPGLGDVDLLGVGQWHTCARVRGDGVRCWGGNMGPHAAAANARVPARVEGFDDVTRFALGVDTCALTASRALHCWGNARMYTYQRADLIEGRDRHYTLRALRDLDDVALGWSSTSAGDALACARERGGALWCWGDGYHGGRDRATGARSDRMVPVNVARIGDATAIAVAADHACVIRAGAKLWCWGRNEHGQVGDGTTVERAVPVEVSSSAAVVAVSVAEGHTCAQTRDGALWCWGDNRRGQLGDGTTDDRHAPTPVRWQP